MTGEDLPDGLVREAHAPDRTVVLWVARHVDEVLTAVAQAGELPLTVHPTETLDFVEHSGAPAALLVDADLLDDETVEVLVTLRQLHPQTRVAVLADEQSSAAGLLRAMRAGLGSVVSPQDVEAVAELVRGGTGSAGARVLAVGAHPDDVEIGCGATLLRHRAAGHPVTILTLSRGAVGGERETRRREAIGAAVMLGAELLMGDLPDTRMSGRTRRSASWRASSPPPVPRRCTSTRSGTTTRTTVPCTMRP